MASHRTTVSKKARQSKTEPKSKFIFETAFRELCRNKNVFPIPNVKTMRSAWNEAESPRMQTKASSICRALKKKRLKCASAGTKKGSSHKIATPETSASEAHAKTNRSDRHLPTRGEQAAAAAKGQSPTGSGGTRRREPLSEMQSCFKIGLKENAGSVHGSPRESFSRVTSALSIEESGLQTSTSDVSTPRSRPGFSTPMERERDNANTLLVPSPERRVKSRTALASEAISEEEEDAFHPTIWLEYDETQDPAKVTEFYIRGWRVDVIMMNVLDTCFPQMGKLHTISLSNAGLSCTTLSILSPCLGHCKNLKTLTLDENAISGADFPLLVETGKTIQTLSLRFCALTAKDAAAIGRMLGSDTGSNTTLLTLLLTGNAMGDAGAIHLANGLKMNRCLLVLNLTANGIGNRGANELASALTCYPFTHAQVIERRKMASRADYMALAIVEDIIQDRKRIRKKGRAIEGSSARKALLLKPKNTPTFSSLRGRGNRNSSPGKTSQRNSAEELQAPQHKLAHARNRSTSLTHARDRSSSLPLQFVTGKAENSGSRRVAPFKIRGTQDTPNATQKQSRLVYGTTRARSMSPEISKSETCLADTAVPLTLLPTEYVAAKRLLLTAEKSLDSFFPKQIEPKLTKFGTSLLERYNEDKENLQYTQEKLFESRPEFMARYCDHIEHEDHKEIDCECRRSLWSNGNQTLLSLNLARNDLGDEAIRSFFRAVSYQETHKEPNATGLLRLCLHKNSPVSDLKTLQSLNTFMERRNPTNKKPVKGGRRQ